MDPITRLLGTRNRIIAASALTFLLWQGGLLAGGLLPDATRLANAAALIGGIAWAASTAFLLVYMRRVARARAQDTLSDERIRHVQTRAFATSYWLLGAALAVLLGLSGFVALDATAVVRGLLILAVVAPMMIFLWLDRSGEGEDEGEDA